MSAKPTDISQIEAAVIMRRGRTAAGEPASARESVYAPPGVGMELARMLGRRVAETPGYSLVFLRSEARAHLDREGFTAAMAQAARLEAGVDFGLVFPLEG